MRYAATLLLKYYYADAFEKVATELSGTVLVDMMGNSDEEAKPNL